ncbi:MAG: hypothetical protein R2744_07575 [Bacteroidales bacterium]
MANGQPVTAQASGAAPAEPGGGAGSVLISANGYSVSSLSIEAKGGDGGNSTNALGFGGGGSGGFIWVSPSAGGYTNVTMSADGGNSGNYRWDLHIE